MDANNNPTPDAEEVHTFCPICGDGYLYGYKVVCAACLAAGKTEETDFENGAETPEESLARLEQDLSTPDDPRDEFFAQVDRFDGYDEGDRAENFEAEQEAPEEGRSPLGTIQPEHENNPPF